MAISRGVAWTDTDLLTLDRVYPLGGWEAAVEAMPHRSRSSIVQRASTRGLRLKKYRGGFKAGTRKRIKPEAPYAPTTQAEQRLQDENARFFGVMQEWGAITRTGELRPVVRSDEWMEVVA